MTSIRIKKLTRTFDTVRAVDDISLLIKHGELFTLLGPSGCGKTTLLRMIAGFADVESGSISFDERRIDGLPHIAATSEWCFRTTPSSPTIPSPET